MLFQHYKIVPSDNDIGEDVELVTDVSEADLIGSRLESDSALHWPFFDLDLGASIEASDFGQVVTLKLAAKREDVVALLEDMHEAGLIHPPFLDSGVQLGNDSDELNELAMTMVPRTELRQSATRGHFHLLPLQPIKWRQYRNLLWCGVDVGVIGPRYLEMAVRYGQSFLWLPGRKVACTEMLKQAEEKRFDARVQRGIDAQARQDARTYGS